MEHAHPVCFTPPHIRKIISPVAIHAQRQLATDGHGGCVLGHYETCAGNRFVTPSILLARGNRSIKADLFDLGYTSGQRSSEVNALFCSIIRVTSAFPQRGKFFFSEAASRRHGAVLKTYGVNGQ
jgi:hypothetical protein